MKRIICACFVLFALLGTAVAEPVELFGGIMSIELPEGFDTMPENIVKLRYADKSRPQYIYSNAQATGSISIKYKTDAVCTQDNLEQVKQAMEQGFPKMSDDFVWIKQGYATIKRTRWVVLEFSATSKATKTKMHTIVLLTSMADHLLMVNMSATAKDFAAVGKDFKKTVASLKI